MSFNVVYEYTQAAGGYAGTRFSTSYTNEADCRASKHDPRMKAIATGVTDKEALNLTSLTPEICRFTSAIEEACYADDGKVDTNILDHHLFMAQFALEHDRELVNGQLLTRPTEFPLCVAGEEDTEKNQLLRSVLEANRNKTGQVSVNNMLSIIRGELLDILGKRLTKSLSKLIELDD